MGETAVTEYSIKQDTEINHFDNPVTQQFFTFWCEKNDSIVPNFIPRDEWDRTTMIQQRPDDKSTLSIPTDLKLWEMVDVIEQVDQDTFAHNPEGRPNVRQRLRELGNRFINGGIYVAQNLDEVTAGRETAIQTARDLYRYGNALRTGNYDEETPLEEIAQNSISRAELEDIDKMFGVDKVAKFKELDPEQARKRVLGQFFKTTEEAKTSPQHRKAIEKAHERYLLGPIMQPQQEIDAAIFRRGVEKIMHEMGKKGWTEDVKKALGTIGIDVEGQERNLREILDIPEMKAQLARAHETGDVEQISAKEREIALQIQKVVGALPYKSAMAIPSDIVKNQFRNCAGATMIGGALLRDVGINYVVGSLTSHTTENHSIAVLQTSDGKLYWQDFTYSPKADDPDAFWAEEEITDDDIYWAKQEGRDITLDAVREDCKHPSDEGPVLKVKKSHEHGALDLLSLSGQEKGEQAQVLAWINGQPGEYVDPVNLLIASQKILELAPNHFGATEAIAIILCRLGKFDEALEWNRKMSKFGMSYKEAGKAELFGENRQYAEALKVLEPILESESEEDQDLAFIAFQHIIKTSERNGQMDALNDVLKTSSELGAKLYLGLASKLLDDAIYIHGKDQFNAIKSAREAANAAVVLDPNVPNDRFMAVYDKLMAHTASVASNQMQE